MMRSLVLAPALLAAAVGVAGCGSSAPTATAGAGTTPSASAAASSATTVVPVAPSATVAAPVTVPGTGTTSATLSVGQRLVVTLAAGDLGTPKDAAVLMASDGGYRAVAPGKTTVSIERRPHCLAGQLCSQLVQLVGTVTVIVR